MDRFDIRCLPGALSVTFTNLPDDFDVDEVSKIPEVNYCNNLMA